MQKSFRNHLKLFILTPIIKSSIEINDCFKNHVAPNSTPLIFEAILKKPHLFGEHKAVALSSMDSSSDDNKSNRFYFGHLVTLKNVILT